MVANSMNENLKQAYQGSVSAIIQILNDRLASTGVRTRAIFEGRVLQLLCEAPKHEQLEREPLVERVKAVLEDISPRNIRRVNINARIVEEQQLLWLEEIQKHPETLLWSQEISLSRPNLMKHFMAGLKNDKPEMPAYAQDTPTGRQPRKGPSPNLIAGGVVSVGVLALAGFGAMQLFQPKNETAQTPANAVPTNSAQTPNQPGAQPKQPAVADNFGAAVRLAQAAAQASQTAKTSAQWQSIAQKWGQASDLMAKVPASSANYAIAQDRTVKYRKNQAIALKKAQS